MQNSIKNSFPIDVKALSVVDFNIKNSFDNKSEEVIYSLKYN